uniref:Ribonuclease P protein subunit p29 n=1 Tax=Trichuris muris TaxID=70415 RepID=A0A5S6QIY6_TRIMR
MRSFEDVSQADRASALVKVMSSMQYELNNDPVELDYGCSEVGFNELDSAQESENDAQKQDSAPTAASDDVNGVDLEEGEVVEVEDGEILDDTEARLGESSVSHLPNQHLDERRDGFGPGRQNYNDRFGWKKDECRRNSSSPYLNRSAGRVSRQQESSATIADEAWKRGLEAARLLKRGNEKRETGPQYEDKKIRLSPTDRLSEPKECTRRSSQEDDQEMRRRYEDDWRERSEKTRSISRSPIYRDEYHSQLTTSEHRPREVSPRVRGYSYTGGRQHDWERRYDRGRSEHHQSSSYITRERSRPLPYVRTLQDDIDWRDPWQRPISPGRNKRSVGASNEQRHSTDIKHCYGRSRSSTASESSETTDSKDYHHRRRKLNKRRRRSVTKERRSSSADSFSSISSDLKAKRLYRSTSRRSRSKSSRLSSAVDKESEENPRDLVRTIFAEKKQLKLSGSVHLSSVGSPSESLAGSQKSVSKDEVTGDVDEEDSQEVKEVRREDLVRKLRMIEAEIEKRRSRLTTRPMRSSEFKKHYSLEVYPKRRKEQRPSRRKVFKPKYSCYQKLQLKYENMLPIHEMWKQYMQSVEGEDNIVKADLHGALLLVSSSKCSSQVGIRGLVMVESRNVFLLLTPDDRLVTVPKEGSCFQFVLNNRLYVLVGNAICVTPHVRAHRKFKLAIPLPDFRDRLVSPPG